MTYASPNVVGMIKPREMRWAGHVAQMGEIRLRIKFWSGNLKGSLGRPRRRWEHADGTEPSGFIKGGVLLFLAS
jgi:hypothetical protein